MTRRCRWCRKLIWPWSRYAFRMLGTADGVIEARFHVDCLLPWNIYQIALQRQQEDEQ